MIAPIAAGLPGATVAVTGQTAGTFDFNETMKSRAPLVIGFVLALAFLLLLVTFRSLVILFGLSKIRFSIPTLGGPPPALPADARERQCYAAVSSCTFA